MGARRPAAQARRPRLSIRASGTPFGTTVGHHSCSSAVLAGFVSLGVLADLVQHRHAVRLRRRLDRRARPAPDPAGAKRSPVPGAASRPSCRRCRRSPACTLMSKPEHRDLAALPGLAGHRAGRLRRVRPPQRTARPGRRGRRRRHDGGRRRALTAPHEAGVARSTSSPTRTALPRESTLMVATAPSVATARSRACASSCPATQRFSMPQRSRHCAVVAGQVGALVGTGAARVGDLARGRPPPRAARRGRRSPPARRSRPAGRGSRGRRTPRGTGRSGRPAAPAGGTPRRRPGRRAAAYPDADRDQRGLHGAASEGQTLVPPSTPGRPSGGRPPLCGGPGRTGSRWPGRPGRGPRRARRPR